MLFDFVDSITADSLGRIDFQQPVDEVRGFRREVGGDFVDPAGDFLVEFAVVVFVDVERTLAGEEFVYQTAKVPEVD
jgi:hypothetical protein